MATQVAISPKLEGGVFRISKYAGKYSDEIVREILERIADGETYASIKRSDPDRFPHQSAFADWLNASTALDIAHARARMLGADIIAEECLQIADDATGDVYIATDAHGKPYAKIDGDCVQRAKLKVETRLKLLAKWRPEKYGEKLMHAGHDGKEIKIDTRLDIRAIADQLRAVTRKPDAAADAVIEHDDGSDLV